MEKPWEFNGEAVLVFSDTHQRINWAREVMTYESGNYDKIVFLGDMADSFHSPPEVSGIRETAAFHRELVEMDNCRCLLGNHCSPLAETARMAQTFQHKRKIFNFCSGFTRSKSIEYAKEMGPDQWKKVKLFTLCNGWLLSHAGMPKWMWQMGESMCCNEGATEDVLKQLWRESEFAMDRIEMMEHAFLRCGYVRGGDHESGGITWADEKEFEDALCFPQIFGHTSLLNTIRKFKKSYCIDGSQTCYAIIKKDSSLIFKSLDRQHKPISPVFVNY